MQELNYSTEELMLIKSGLEFYLTNIDSGLFYQKKEILERIQHKKKEAKELLKKTTRLLNERI